MTDRHDLPRLLDEVVQLQVALGEAEQEWGRLIDLVGPEHRESARNLAHYWALRQRDLRELQGGLARRGLSSLGRSEGQVAQNLGAVDTALRALADAPHDTPGPRGDFNYGQRALRRRATRLFGPTRAGLQSRIMVTLPAEAATNPGLVKDMVQRGMAVARINCAHDDETTWSAMVRNVREAERATGSRCTIAMDVAGPKLRTGPVADGPSVVRVKPRRSRTGHVIAPGRCLLVPDTAGEVGVIPRIPVSPRWLAQLSVGDFVHLHDARGANRHLVVERILPGGAAATHTCYLVPGIHLHGTDGTVGTVGQLPVSEQWLTIRQGQVLRLTADQSPADPDDDGTPRIGCTLPHVLGAVRPGDPVQFDDGTISGTTLAVEPGEVTIRITRAAERGAKLRGGRGINLPATHIPVPALTETDRAQLPFIAAHADVVQLSFVRQEGDVEALLAALADLGDEHLGVVVKIETAQAFRHLPAILLTAMRRHAAGVMIARGDLAVECGYERLAELQEEILWLCEAAHLPVVWATEVLDRLAKSGQPTRAEITDAAMAGRAECVMLNKGPHILEAIETLDDVLRRVGGLSRKKTPLLRPLSSWRVT